MRILIAVVMLSVATTVWAAPKPPAPKGEHSVSVQYIHRASAGTVYRVTSRDHRGRILETHTLVVLKEGRGFLWDGRKVRNR